MKPGAALAQWLADRDAQQRSYDRVEASGQQWRGQPLIARLERELFENPDFGPEQLIGAARRFIDCAGDIDLVMREMIAICRADPWFRPPFYPISSEVQSGLLLCNHPSLTISIGITGIDMLAAKKISRTGGASINFTGFLTLMRFVKAGNALLSFWESDPITDDFSAATAGRCRPVGRRRIRDGEELVFDGRRQSFVIEHAEGDILYFQAVARVGCAPVGAEYDSDSLECIGASSTDDAGSRLQMMVSLLRALGRDEAFPLFEEALASPQFYTRWHVMREMLAMDAEAALPSLRRMAEADSHADVRAAARQTLELFFADDEAADAASVQGDVACRA